MKIASTAIVAFLLVTSASVQSFATEGAMIGRDPTYKGGVTGVSHGGSGGGGGGAGPNASCSSAVGRCTKAFRASAAASASAGESCKQTGTFTNPQGRSFSGLKKN
jgi:hypothetical protein